MLSSTSELQNPINFDTLWRMTALLVASVLGTHERFLFHAYFNSKRVKGSKKTCEPCLKAQAGMEMIKIYPTW